MSGGREDLRKFAERVAACFVATVDSRQAGEPVTTAQLHAHLHKFFKSAALSALMTESYGILLDAADAGRQRGDPFQRLMVHPLSEAFEAEELSRDILPSYFSFLHLVLGDAKDEMTGECVAIFDHLREQEGFTWDMFYTDPRSKLIFWAALARVAESFRRFELRRDWFIGLMQNQVHALSLSSNSFIPHAHGEEAKTPHPFGRDEFKILFDCLFQPLRRLSDPDRLAFQRGLGAPPEALFAKLYGALAD